MDGWQIILFYNNSMNFSFCHLRQSEFLLVDNLFRLWAQQIACFFFKAVVYSYHNLVTAFLKR